MEEHEAESSRPRTPYDEAIDEIKAESGIDFDAPGKPQEGKMFHPDGTWSPFEFPQRKWDNYAELARKFGRPGNVKREHVEAEGLDWSEWNWFIEALRRNQQVLDGFITAYGALEGFDPPETETDEFGLKYLKDPPETTPPTGKPEPGAGREPPPDFTWEA